MLAHSSLLTRRTFLTATAAFSAGAASFSLTCEVAAAALADKPARKFTIDLVPGAIGVSGDQRQIIDFAAAHGFESVQPQPDFLGGLSDVQLGELKAGLTEKKLTWGAAGLPVEFRQAEDKFTADLADLPKRAKALQRAGATRVGTWIRPSHATMTYLENFKQHVRRLTEVARILEDHGLRFGLEYVGPKTSWTAARYAFVHTMAEQKELIAAIGRKNMGLVLDSWHWYTAGETEADLLTLTNADVVACDLNDAPAGLAVDQQMDLSREPPMATGVIDLKTFMGALVKIGYDGPVRAEPFNAALKKLPPNEAVAATAAAMKRAFELVGPRG